MAEEVKPVNGSAVLTQAQQHGDAWSERHSSRQRNGSRRVRVLAPEVLRSNAESGQIRAIDAAAFLQRYPRPLSWLKLQDLLYLALAWHLVWDEELLFPDPLKVSDDGIRIDSVEQLLHGQFEVRRSHLRMARPGRLADSQQQTLAGILNFYGNRSHFRLAEQIRQDPAWQKARAAGEGTAVDPALLYRHYRSL